MLTVRNGPHVTHARFSTLAGAMGALEERLDELAPQAKRRALEVFKRRFDASRQVAVRAELASPGSRLWGGVRGGIDLRGDGSTEAYLGRVKRSLVSPQAGESAFDALRRVLGERAGR
jgi:hypothetical protein